MITEIFQVGKLNHYGLLDNKRVAQDIFTVTDDVATKAKNKIKSQENVPKTNVTRFKEKIHPGNPETTSPRTKFSRKS